MSCLCLLLEAKPDPRSVSYCLGRALDFEDEQAARLFLEHGADPALVVPWSDHHSHLQKAVANARSAALIRLMLERGADPNLKDDSGMSAYREAVRSGNTELVDLLEEFAADRSAASEHDRLLGALGSGQIGRRPDLMPDPQWLVRAARRNDLSTIKQLLAAGADVNAAIDLPPLHAACYAGHLAAAQLLYEHGASLTQKNVYGGTALGTCIYGSADCCHEQGGPGTLLPEEIPARDYAALTEWLIEQGAAQPQSIWGGSEAVREVLRKHGVSEPMSE